MKEKKNWEKENLKRRKKDETWKRLKATENKTQKMGKSKMEKRKRQRQREKEKRKGTRKSEKTRREQEAKWEKKKDEGRGTPWKLPHEEDFVPGVFATPSFYFSIRLYIKEE